MYLAKAVVMTLIVFWLSQISPLQANTLYYQSVDGSIDMMTSFNKMADEIVAGTVINPATLDYLKVVWDGSQGNFLQVIAKVDASTFDMKMKVDWPWVPPNIETTGWLDLTTYHKNIGADDLYGVFFWINLAPGTDAYNRQLMEDFGANYISFEGLRDDWDSFSGQVVLNNNPDTSIPEPATMFLFGTGLVSLAGYRTKRKKKK